MFGTAYSKRSFALIILGLLVPCLMIGVPAVIAYKAEGELSASFAWVSHTHEVQRHLQKILSLILEAESGQRGHLLTTQDTFLETYRSALRDIPRETMLLRDLTASDAVQRENAKQLGPLVALKLKFMAETIYAQQQGGRAALALVSSRQGIETMNPIRALLSRMDDEEQRLLDQRQHRLAANARWSTLILSTLVAINVLFAAAVVYLLRRLSKLDSLVTVCAWSRTVEYQGEWLSFEEYLLKRFDLNTSHGISPSEAKRAFSQFSKSFEDEAAGEAPKHE